MNCVQSSRLSAIGRSFYTRFVFAVLIAAACFSFVPGQHTTKERLLGGGAIVPVGAGSATPSDNDYTRLNNAVQSAVAGQTITLLGTFDWTEPNAATSWALGSDGVNGTADDYSIYPTAGKNNITFTAAALGDATIQGPGDIPAFDLEAVFYFDGGPNQNWTISNIRFLDFDNPIGMFFGGGGATAFNGTHITNNYIRLPPDLNGVVAPTDTSSNIAIQMAFGADQVISGNTIDLAGNGVSSPGAVAPQEFSTSVAYQSNSSSMGSFPNLQITNNVVRVLNAVSANPEITRGIWENSGCINCDIIVSGNSFTNLGAGNNPATNLQSGFRVSSSSSPTTTVTFQNNLVSGANVGFEWYPGVDMSGHLPVQLISNTIMGNATGVLVQSQATANLSFNRIVGNTSSGLNNVDGIVTAENNWWGCNAGPGLGGCDSVTGSVDADPWLVLGVSANPSVMFPGGMSAITADMTHNSDGAVAGTMIPLTPVSFTSTEGTVLPTSGTVTAGQANTSFTSTTANSGTACADVDNQNTCANITVVAVNVAISPVAPGSETPTDNDYTRINNAVQAAIAGQTITLTGIFDWTEANAAASWALGSNGVPGGGDDYSVLVPANLHNVTFTSGTIGGATIQGPGDLAAVNLEGVLLFDGGDNRDWTISNIRFQDFDLAIAMFSGASTDPFNNTHITNNYIRVARDLNAIVAPADVNQNIGIYYSFGINQVISSNTIDIQGDGVSNGTNFATDIGMQCDSGLTIYYDGLLITNNTVNVLHAQSANPERVFGIWENGNAHQSNIEVSGNSFTNLDAGNNPALNLQRGFRVSSHSSATTTVKYDNNTVTGANTGFEWTPGPPFAGNQPVVITRNTITNGGRAVLIQGQGSANLTFNRIVGNTITGVNNVDGTLTAENNWWGCNTGPGTPGCDSVTGIGDSDPWIVLRTVANPNPVPPGGMSTVTADMRFNSDNVNMSGIGTLPNTPVTFQATNGSMTPTSGTVSLGTGDSVFTSNGLSPATACSTVDNQQICTAIVLAPLPAITITDVSMAEGNVGPTAFTFTVTISSSPVVNATVQYQTSDLSAVAPGDYLTAAGTVTFVPAGPTSQNVTVTVNGDTSIEANEAFLVNLSNPVNADILDSTGRGTLVNDDAPTACVTRPDPMAAWYKADGNTLDTTGGQTGVFEPTPASAAYTAGMVGQGFDLNGTNDVRVAASTGLDVGASPQGMSVDAWIRPDDLTVPGPITEWNNGVSGVQFFHSSTGGGAQGPGDLVVNLVRADNGLDVLVYSGPGALTQGDLQHVAFTYDRVSGLARIYLNGTAIPVGSQGGPVGGTTANVGIFMPQTGFALGYNFFMGARPGVAHFDGVIDEVEVFSRSVVATEIAAIASAGSFGKCLGVTAAGVSVSGRVLISDGRGLRNAVVVLTDSRGVAITATSSTLGYYRFDGVAAGETYIIGVESKRYQFQPRILNITDALTDVDLLADGGSPPR